MVLATPRPFLSRYRHYMSFCNTLHQTRTVRNRLGHMATQLSDPAKRFSLEDLPKSNIFTAKLPPDPAFETPKISHGAPREALGPRLVKGALYTFVRPEPANKTELLDVSSKAMADLGLTSGEELTPQFKAVVSGNHFFWTEENGGIYPWAQCYGGNVNLSIELLAGRV